METYNDWLAHHGILGQKWGKRNGPPYPLNEEDHSASEKKAGYKKSLDSGGEITKISRRERKKAEKEQKRLQKEQEKKESLRKFVSGEEVTRKELDQAQNQMFDKESDYADEFENTAKAKWLSEQWTKAWEDFENSDYDYESKEYEKVLEFERQYLIAEGEYAAKGMLDYFGKEAIIRYQTETPYYTRKGFMTDKDTIEEIIKKYAEDYYYTHRE